MSNFHITLYQLYFDKQRVAVIVPLNKVIMIKNCKNYIFQKTQTTHQIGLYLLVVCDNAVVNNHKFCNMQNK